MLFEQFEERLRHRKARKEREKKVLAYSGAAREVIRTRRRRLTTGRDEGEEPGSGSMDRELGVWDRGSGSVEQRLESGERGADGGETRRGARCDHGRAPLRRPGATPQSSALTWSLRRGRSGEEGARLRAREGGGSDSEAAASAEPHGQHRAGTHRDSLFHQPPGSHTCGAASRRPRPGAGPAPPAALRGYYAHWRLGSVPLMCKEP